MVSLRKRVLLLGPPNPFLENSRSVPRLGLLYLGTILQRAGAAVTIRHLDTLEEMEGLLAGPEFDFIGISATTREYPDAVQILNYVKREQYTAVVAIGGSHASALPEECRHNGFDLTVVGEAEGEIRRLASLHFDTPQIVDCGFIETLDRLPIPDRSLLDPYEGWQPFLDTGEGPERRVASILLSRGCPCQCAFCGPHYLYRRRSEGNIRAELQILREQGYRGLVLLDDLPFLNRQHVESFCRAVRPFSMKFRCNFRADLVTSDVACVLARTGCCRIQLGVESASQLILDTVNKRTASDINGRAVTICHDHGIQVKAMFVWGLPGDGPDTAEAIVAWVDRYRPDAIQIASFAPLPGSPLWNRGFHRHVTDYRALSFFGPGQSRPSTSGVSNDRFSAEALSQMRDEILERVASITYIDRGLPTHRAAGSQKTLWNSIDKEHG